MTKYGPSEWGAQVGVTSALLAKMGYTGETDLFVGEFGFWRYTGKNNKGEWNEKFIEGLGTKWLCHEITYKQYPCGV
jgi:2-methylcitrate dehydratase PrpD